MLYPLRFKPVFMERVWGGRSLATAYGKTLPPESPIGESWEITDRPEAVSVITNGPLAGKDLHWLMTHHRESLLGNATPPHHRFPLLIKIIDAREKLSLQVHPPADLAALLGGEPKTEMWYLTRTSPDAALYVGLRQGVTRAQFEEGLRQGTVADCFHRHSVRSGDAMFLPSGRVHALGAGCMIFEVQQNSNTTYRVYDWDRLGMDGKPRELHLEQSLAAIDFEDYEPDLIRSPWQSCGNMSRRELVRDRLFTVDNCRLTQSSNTPLADEGLSILGVVSGQLTVQHNDNSLVCSAGDFCLIPACAKAVSLSAVAPTEFLHIRPGSSDGLQ